MKQKLSLVPASGLDQPVQVQNIVERVAQVKSAIEQAADNGNTDAAFNVVGNLSQLQQLAGIGLATALYQMRLRAEDLELFGDDENLDMDDDVALETAFMATVFAKVGRAPDTIRRYIQVGKMLDELPKMSDDTKTMIMGRQMQDLIAVSQYQNEHGKLSAKQWKKVADAEDNVAVRKTLREFKGEPENSKDLQIILRPDGTLEAWLDGQIEQIGFIRTRPEDLENTVRNKAVSRLKKRCRIQEAQ